MLIVPLGGRPGWAFPWATLDFDFSKNRGMFKGRSVSPLGLLTATQNTTVATDLLPSDAAGFKFNTFAANVPRPKVGSGLLVEEARTNVLLNSTAPVTQTTASLGTGVYTLWLNGSGTATPTAGSATITGASAATQGSPGGFTVSVAGTVTVTLTGGTPNAFQCELGTWGSSLIVTGGATATRNADVVTLSSVPTFGGAYTGFAKATYFAPTAFATNQVAFQVSDGTVNNRWGVFRTGSTGTGSAVLTIASAGQTVPAVGAAISQNASAKLAYAVAVTDQALAEAGSITTTTANAAIASGLTTINLGASATPSSQLNGVLERLAFASAARVPNSQLQAITT